MAASICTCIGISCLFKGRLHYKDFVYSSLVGGVMIGSSAAMIKNISGAIFLGIGGGVLSMLLSVW